MKFTQNIAIFYTFSSNLDQIEIKKSIEQSDFINEDFALILNIYKCPILSKSSVRD